MATWRRAVKTVKSRDEGWGRSRSRNRNLLFFPFFFLCPFRWRISTAHRWRLQGEAPGQPHFSSQSHLVDHGSPTQSLCVPQEAVDSSSTGPRCYRESATGATGFLWLWLLCITWGTWACDSSSSQWNVNVLKEIGRRKCEMFADRKLSANPDMVVFGSLRYNWAHYSDTMTW